jgi:hypothetical protein
MYFLPRGSKIVYFPVSRSEGQVYASTSVSRTPFRVKLVVV